MTMKMTRIAAAFTALLLAGSPAVADEPGPGGSRTKVPVTGEEIYRYVCASCHMQDGSGGEGAGRIPALAKNPSLESSDYLLFMIANGKGAMPSFKPMLTPAQMASVSTYIRGSMGNRYKKPVTEAQAKTALADVK